MRDEILMRVRLNDLEAFDKKMKKAEGEKEEELLTMGFDNIDSLVRRRTEKMIDGKPAEELKEEEKAEEPKTQTGDEVFKKFMDVIRG